jgi:DNA polymerase III epsilon subunit family exonuclease
MAYKSKTQLPEISGSRLSYCTIDPKEVSEGKSEPCSRHFHKEYADAFFESSVKTRKSISEVTITSGDESVTLAEYTETVEKVKVERIVMPEPEITVSEYLESLGDKAVSVLNSDTHLKEYAVIDFETTGGRYNTTDRAVQLAIIHVDEQGNVTDRWASFINPERPVEFVDIHGVTQEIADVAPTFKELAPEILSRLEGRAIAAHNVAYDLRFLKSEFARLGMKVELDAENSMCTMTTAKSFLGEDITSTKLGDCLERAGIKYEEENGRGAHDASVDAVATAKLLGHFIKTQPNQVYTERLKLKEKALAAEAKAAKLSAKV